MTPEAEIARLTQALAQAQEEINDAHETIDRATFGAEPGSLVSRLDWLVAHVQLMRVELASNKDAFAKHAIQCPQCQDVALTAAQAQQRREDWLLIYDDLIEALEAQPHQAPCLRYHDRIDEACICWQSHAIDLLAARRAAYLTTQETKTHG